MANYVYIDKTTNINGKIKGGGSKDSKVYIGKYCAIASNFTICTINHDYNYPAVQGLFYNRYFNRKHPGELCNPPTKERTKGNVNIGNDVWIGMNVWVGSGLTIGDGCCIGANSVVTKSLPPYSICVGVPCKPVKKRYNQEVIDFLLDLKWWNWSESKIKRNMKFFYLNLNKISNLNEIDIVD